MLAFVLFLIIVFILAGIIGAVVHGLLWLTVIAAVLFALTILLSGRHLKNRSQR